MQSIHDFPNLHCDLTEDEVNDIFDHHGWRVERTQPISTEHHYTPALVQHEEELWPGINSRGHPLLIGSSRHH